MPHRRQHRTAYRDGVDRPRHVSAPERRIRATARRLCPVVIRSGFPSPPRSLGAWQRSEEPTMGFYIKDLYVHRVPKFRWHDSLTNPPTIPETSPIIRAAALSPHVAVGRGGGGEV